MSRYSKKQVFSGDLNSHPAVLAWSKLGGDRIRLDKIHILKEHRNSKQEQLGAYLLEGVGPSGSEVFAKRTKLYKGLIENKIYSEILPHLPVNNLEYYGLLEEENSKYCWLFLENAIGKSYSPIDPDHRVAAGRWLGNLHLFTVNSKEVDGLPDRGPKYYHNYLESAYEHILPYISHRSMNSQGKTILRKILTNLEFLDAHWQELEDVSKSLPNTIVHSDFLAKNIRLRDNHKVATLLVFDWEYAGWGTPAADLAQSPGNTMHISANPDIKSYLDTIRDPWPYLDISTLERIAKVGTLFRILAAINWATMELSNDWFQKPMSYLTVYETKLSQEIQIR